MKSPRQPAALLALARTILFALLLLSLSCGGGGGGSSSGPPPPPPPPTPQPLIITTSILADAIFPRPYDLTFQASGGTGSQKWTITQGAMPNSLVLSQTGQIVGTCTETGMFSFTVQVQDSAASPQNATKQFTLRAVQSLSVNSSVLPGGQLNLQYSTNVQVGGGVPPYSYSIASGQMLPGLILNNQTGQISGAPTGGGPVTFTVRVTDNTSPPQNVLGQLTMNLSAPLRILTTSLPDGKVGAIYAGGSGYVSWMGGSPPFTWSVTAGSAPPGLQPPAFGSNLIFGRPTALGIYNFTLQLTDGTSPPMTASQSFTIKIDDLFLTTLNSSFPVGVIGQVYPNFTLQASGGTPPYSWTAQSGSFPGTPGLPPGLSLDPSNGVISGNPSLIGFFSVDFEVTDSATPINRDRLTKVMLINPLPSIVTTVMGDGIVGQPYSGNLLISGGNSNFPYTLTVIGGNPPPGLNFNINPNTYSIYVAGTPTVAGNFSIKLQLADGSSPPLFATGDVSVRVNTPLVLNTPSLPPGKIGQSYSAPLAASGGAPPYTWRMTALLPNGLALDPASGLVAGLPIVAVQGISLTALVTDSSNPKQLASQNYLLDITSQMFIPTSRLPVATVGTLFEAQLNVIGGSGSVTWSIASGTLPAGLVFDSNSGTFRGTATGEESQVLTVQATDSSPLPKMATRILALVTRLNPGRNDSIATATPLSSGTFRASISPTEDTFGSFSPDNDYFELTAMPGTWVLIEIKADRLSPASPMDSVIEIVDATGKRHATCQHPSIVVFDQPCMNDDGVGGSVDSKLNFLVTGSAGIPALFYVRVLDWSGMARPDFLYTITISGAN